ncbi:tRNA 2'-phosphotransferase 1 [Exaiptasia diaphana]|uniref:2'-phosphotransferase n=1 Tax=Exaiptasia diaphana TaxID=2652724 RepID=A0A913X083_EXADI|nr:tRNA 2'-phosphotransferase 1 [Exaiptasia diaphana]KXJ29944.1 tRNA 2'-phosphotransferase 1 [Exaiptasia diaphana]
MASNRGRGSRSTGRDNPDVKLSKALSYILRHGAEKEGLVLHEGGFVFVDEILQKKQFSKYTEENIRNIVDTNDKKRFALKTDDATGKLMVRANQGHTLEVEGLELQPISGSVEAPTVLHGTYLEAWQFIKEQGLCRMARNHIHFAPGEPGKDGVISGMRMSCQVIVYINIDKAIQDGYKFYRSANNVILCPGNENGFLPTKYFERVIQLRPRKELPFS